METSKPNPSDVNPGQSDADVLGSIDELLAADIVKYDYIPIGSSGKRLRIGSLSAGAMLAWTEANEGEAKKTAGLRMIKDSIVDKNGNRVGTDADVEKLKNLGHGTCEGILEKVLNLNGLKVKASGEAGITDSAKKD